MPLNESKGNMYPFVTHTWNPVKGRCPHDCPYCYMKRFKLAPVRFESKELKVDLGICNFIFVGSSCDMWANEIPPAWIEKTLEKCRKQANRYLFQSKNPIRFTHYLETNLVPDRSVFGTTIESDRDHFSGPETNIPPIDARVNGIIKTAEFGYPVTVTIEPIMDFDLNTLLELVNDIDPLWVTVGADSKGHNLPEPNPEKVRDLVNGLRRNFEVVVKDNLWRLMQ